MGKVFKKVVSAPFSGIKAIGGALGGALDVPVLGDIMKIGSNFIPGVGPLVSMGLEAFDQFTGEPRTQTSGFSPSSWGAMAANPLAMALMQKQSQNRNPSQANFSMMPGLSGELDPSYNYLTEADMRTYGTMQGYADVFNKTADRYGSMTDRSFEAMMDTITGDKGTLDWAKIGDLARAETQAQNAWMLTGSADDKDTMQGAKQQGIIAQAMSGFGGSALLDQAGLNFGKDFAQRNLEGADRLLSTFGGIEVQNLDSLRRSSIANYQGAMQGELSARESAYGAATGAEEMLYGRDQENFMRQFNRRISPELEKHIRYVPWWERQLQTMGEMAVPDLYDTGVGILKGLLPKPSWNPGNWESPNPVLPGVVKPPVVAPPTFFKPEPVNPWEPSKNTYTETVNDLMPWLGGPFGYR